MGNLGVTSVHTVRRTNHTSGFEISFTEYAKAISIITLPSHRRRDRKSQVVSTSSRERSVALVGYAMFATVAGTSVTVDGTNTASNSAQRLGCVWAHEGARQNRHLPFWLKVPCQGIFSSFVCEDVARFMECQTDVLCAVLLYMLVKWCTENHQ